MGTQTTLFIAVLIGAFAMYSYNTYFQLPPLPKLESVYWGEGSPPAKEDASIKPFKIQASEQVLVDLKQRLKNRRPLTPPLEGTEHQYGINAKLLEEVLEYWENKYNWKEREAFLNQYPQFTTNIQGLNIHFLHVKPKADKNIKILPLLMLHGWPGSVREFYEAIPMLTKPQEGKDFVFEVIVASLPGYGFSDGARKPGLGAPQMGVIMKNLMKRLGFEKFYIQGGDFGGNIGTHMGALFPENVKGLHNNMCLSNTLATRVRTFLGALYPSFVVSAEQKHRMYPLGELFQNYLYESGYFHLQATKPDTLGVGVNDSPSGLAAYILEKFIAGTNPAYRSRLDGGLKEKFTYDQLIDNLMFYWLSRSATTSFRLYAETINKAYFAMKFEEFPVQVPTACLKLKNEIFYQPDSFLTDKYPHLIHSKEVAQGGHFAALEEPELLSKDVFVAVEKMEIYHKNPPNK